MSGRRSFWRDRRGASAAEFALVLPLALIFLIGMIDVGRFMWEYNRAEKATQIGARWAAATQMIPNGYANYSYAVDGGIPQGDPIPVAQAPVQTCSGTSSSVTCTCTSCPTGWDTTTNLDAFQKLVGRISQIKPDVGPANVTVIYGPSGASGDNDLGYAGNPNGSDLVPLVTVRLTGLEFKPILLLGNAMDMPDFSYSLTMEDGVGDTSN